MSMVFITGGLSGLGATEVNLTSSSRNLAYGGLGAAALAAAGAAWAASSKKKGLAIGLGVTAVAAVGTALYLLSGKAEPTLRTTQGSGAPSTPALPPAVQFTPKEIEYTMNAAPPTMKAVDASTSVARRAVMSMGVDKLQALVSQASP